MKKANTRVKHQDITCGNPDCGRSFVNPIIVRDINSASDTVYPACPYCLTEIPKEEACALDKKNRKHGEKKVKSKSVELEKRKSIKPDNQSSARESKCPYEFGYLSQSSRNKQIPEECITCSKIVQCMLKKVTE